MSRNKADIKIGTLSVHVDILSEVRKDTPNYNCTSLLLYPYFIIYI